MWRTDSLEKTLMLGKIEGRRRGGWEDEMVGWHHRLSGHEIEQALQVGDGQGSLVCGRPWGHKESDRTERLNWLTELRDWWPRAKFPEKAHYPSQAAATSHRPMKYQAFPTHPNFICHIPPSTSPTDQVSYKQPWLSPLLVWMGSRPQRAAYKQKWGQNQSWTPGAVSQKKRKEIHSCSHRSNRLTHSCWVDTEDFGGNGWLWKQVQAGVYTVKTQSDLTPQCLQQVQSLS